MSEQHMRRSRLGVVAAPRRAATLALATVLLAGCGSGAPLPPPEAVATYEAVAEDLLSAATSVPTYRICHSSVIYPVICWAPGR